MLAALEADLLVAGFVWGDIGTAVPWSAVVALYSHSRRDSAVADQMRRDAQGEYSAYTQDTHLLSIIVDEVRRLSHLYLTAHTDRSKWPKPPEPLHRPGIKHDDDEIRNTPLGVSGGHVGKGAVSKEELERFWNDHAGWLAEQSLN